VSDALTALLDRVADAASKATPGPRGAHFGHDVTGYPAFYIHGLAGDAKRDEIALGASADLMALCDPDLVSALVAVVREAIRCEAQTHSGEKPRAIGDCEGPPCKSLDALRALAESRARKEQP
jgi:hypothetical protein